MAMHNMRASGQQAATRHGLCQEAGGMASPSQSAPRSTSLRMPPLVATALASSVRTRRRRELRVRKHRWLLEQLGGLVLQQEQQQPLQAPCTPIKPPPGLEQVTPDKQSRHTLHEPMADMAQGGHQLNFLHAMGNLMWERGETAAKMEARTVGTQARPSNNWLDITYDMMVSFSEDGLAIGIDRIYYEVECEVEAAINVWQNLGVIGIDGELIIWLKKEEEGTITLEANEHEEEMEECSEDEEEEQTEEDEENDEAFLEEESEPTDADDKRAAADLLFLRRN